MPTRGESGGGRRPKTLILDIFGAYVVKIGGWIAVSDLVDVMGLLDVDEQAVRSAVSRMTRRGLLSMERREGQRGYTPTPEALELLAEGDRRVFSSMEPAVVADGWVLVSFSMPEADRDKRHALRARLMWLGLGNMAAGVWIGPSRIHDELVDAVRRLGLEQYVDVFTGDHRGFGDLTSLVERSWDLDALRVLYEYFLRANTPVRTMVRRARGAVDAERAFVRYTLAVHEWRKLPFLDPGLPVELLPAGWPGRAASDLFVELRSTLEPIALAFVRNRVNG